MSVITLPLEPVEMPDEDGRLTAEEKYRMTILYTKDYNDRTIGYLEQILGTTVERTNGGRVLLDHFQIRRLTILALEGIINKDRAAVTTVTARSCQCQ